MTIILLLFAVICSILITYIFFLVNTSKGLWKGLINDEVNLLYIGNYNSFMNFNACFVRYIGDEEPIIEKGTITINPMGNINLYFDSGKKISGKINMSSGKINFDYAGTNIFLYKSYQELQ
jgi:hypothetical protein